MRLDIFLVQKNLCKSRNVSKELILNGYVSVNNAKVLKPSFDVSELDDVFVDNNDLSKYVSRGGFKLEAALDEFKIDVSDFTAVDIGASTGGFTDCLLQRGAAKVYAIDCGADQLDPSLKSDERIILYENTNARYLTDVFYCIADIVVCDVSFISQKILYPVIKNVMKDDAVFISLIKPQFEAGKKYLNKKGIVKDSKIHEKIIDELFKAATEYSLKPLGIIKSPIEGGDGNTEYLACFVKISEKEQTRF